MDYVRKRIQKIINRSGKMECPICKNQEILVEHHIQGREIHNSEHPCNKANICSNCHRKIHEGLIILEGWFTTTLGLELIWHNKNESSITDNDITPYIIPKKL